MTAEELLAYPGHQHYELVAGTLRVSEPPGGRHGQVAAHLAQLLRSHVKAAGLGTALVESGYIVRRNPDTVRGPDVSFVSKSRLDPDRIPTGFLPFAPDLAVEILSPDDRPGDIAEKVRDYVAGGAKLVWVVDPVRRSVTIHRPDRESETIAPPATLDGGDVLPAFACPLAEL